MLPMAVLRPRLHYTVFKRKRYFFCSGYSYRPHYNAKNDQRKRINSKTFSRVERFENGTVWKRRFPSVDGENNTIWKRWRHHNNTTWLHTTQPWVSKIADRRFQAASLLIAVIFSHLTLLESNLTLLRLLFDFSKREQCIIKLLSLPALGGTRIIKTTRSKPAKTKMVLDKTRTNFSVVGQLLFVARKKVMEDEGREII